MRRLSAFILSAILVGLTLTGCNNKNSGEEPANQSSFSEDELSGVTMRILYDGDQADKFDEVCREFSEETGIEVVLESTGALSPERLEGENAPAVFFIRDVATLEQLHQRELVLNLDTVDDGDLQRLSHSIPGALRLRLAEADNYGIPARVEGLGYLVDTEMLDDLFGAGRGQLVLGKLRACSYEEFTAFCEAVEQYIAEPSDAELSLGGDTYVLEAVKTGRAKNLTGIFAFPGAAHPAQSCHLINTALSAVLDSPYMAAHISGNQLDQLEKPLIAFAEALDTITSHIGGLNGPASRQQDLTDPQAFGQDQGVRMLTEGTALFLPGGSWMAGDLARADSEASGRIELIPFKLPLADEDIAADRTAQEHAAAIVAHVPEYYALNPKVTAPQQKAAVQFLVWMHETRNQQRFVVESFGDIPWYQQSELAISDSLSESVATYVEEGHILSAPAAGAPAEWIGEVADSGEMQALLGREAWSEQDYQAMAEHAIALWKQQRDE